MTALATSADVRTFRGLPAGQDEALLTSLCEAASAFVLKFIGRTGFAIEQVTETYNGTGTRMVLLRHRPVTAVSAMKINGVTIPASNGYSQNGYYLEHNGAVCLRGYRFDRDQGNVDITYSHGYASVPADVKQIVVEMVAMKYERRTRLGVSSKSIGQETISYATTDLSAENRTLLNQYRQKFT